MIWRSAIDEWRWKPGTRPSGPLLTVMWSNWSMGTSLMPHPAVPIRISLVRVDLSLSLHQLSVTSDRQACIQHIHFFLPSLTDVLWDMSKLYIMINNSSLPVVSNPHIISRTVPTEIHDVSGDAAAKKQHVPRVLGYPISIPFIIANEFCERFSYYGMMGESLFFLKVDHFKLFT